MLRWVVLLSVCFLVVHGDVSVYINGESGSDEGDCTLDKPCKTFNFSLGVAENKTIAGSDEIIHAFLSSDIDFEVIERPSSHLKYSVECGSEGNKICRLNESTYIMINQPFTFSRIDFLFLSESLSLYIFEEL
jgi:hypothetical protein